MKVTAKVTAYHPATGLHLTEGEEYSIDESEFADDVFQLKIQNSSFKIDPPEGRAE